MIKDKLSKNPWSWVPSLYFTEGIPYVIVMVVSVIMYKRLGVSNSDIALYTSWLYLPWVIKPLWSPIVDLFKTKRFWIITMQIIIGAGLAGVAFTIPIPNFFQYTLAFLWLLAFSSATHDIAADGFYMLGLTENQQAFFVGIRSTFYRIAMITGQGLLIIIAGYLESSTGLGKINIEVKSVTGNVNYENIIVDESLTKDEKIKLIISPQVLEIETVNISPEKLDSAIQFVTNENIKNGYEENIKQIISEEKINESESWWNKFILSKIEKIIVENFGKKEIFKSPNSQTGNYGISKLFLSKSPSENEQIVVNLSESSGDKSIMLVKGARFIFTKHNWNKPALILFQIDQKLKSETSATFSAISGNIPLAWTITFIILAILFLVFFVYHKFILPYPKSDVTHSLNEKNVLIEFFNTFKLFFKKEKIGISILFLLTYRLGESQLLKMASPFLLDPKELGGLGLTTGEVGFVYGTIGILALITGGLVGGILASKHGLKFWLWWMALAINVPHLVYVYMSYALPDNFTTILICVAFEQLGYGFGFTAYMLYMIYISDGEHKTAHFAITTGFMALGMMIPGMFSGWLQELIGYQHFFVWVFLAAIPSLLIVKLVNVNEDFGKKIKEAN
ncbi:MAG: MFS transporter [Ignavibacteriae bacterium]|nr:MFS transporter [Ignavibacteriota bacterium]